MPLESLLVVLLLLLPLVEWIVRRVREASTGHRQPAPPRQPAKPAPSPLTPAPPALPARPARPSPRGVVSARTPATTGAARSPRAHELRRAVVLMVILDPPRALEPYDVRHVR